VPRPGALPGPPTAPTRGDACTTRSPVRSVPPRKKWLPVAHGHARPHDPTDRPEPPQHRPDRPDKHPGPHGTPQVTDALVRTRRPPPGYEPIPRPRTRALRQDFPAVVFRPHAPQRAGRDRTPEPTSLSGVGPAEVLSGHVYRSRPCPCRPPDRSASDARRPTRLDRHVHVRWTTCPPCYVEPFGTFVQAGEASQW